MRRLSRIGIDPWQIAIAAVGGLLLAVILAGVAGLILNQSVKDVTDEALRYDVKLEDLGDDLRVAVLDVRHFHRNIAFGGASRGAIADFERAYAVLLDEIDEMEQLGVHDPQLAAPRELRAMAETYYAEFQSAVSRYEVDPAAFTRASDHGLVRLEALERAVEAIDKRGEQLAAAALQRVDQVTATSRLVLVAEFAGLALVGLGLAYAAVRMVGELRRLYAREQEAGEALARASQAKSDFIADVSHELRTPLTVLRGNAEVGLELERDCVHAPMLEEIVKETASMARMVEDLLFLARSEGASPPLETEVVETPPFLAELGRRADMLARERGVSLQAEVMGEGRLQIDRARIEQTVLVLVDNAAKYSPDGGGIKLSSSTYARELHIEVSDHGPGIPEAELPHLFDRFYRVDKVRGRKPGGAGLGLSIAKTIVDAHGGRIEVASRVGEGTRMTIRLPLLDASAGARWGERASSEGAP